MTWVGVDVPPLVRARVSMHKSDVMNWFKPVVSFDVDDKETPELTCAELISKIRTELSSIGDKEVAPQPAHVSAPSAWPA